MIVWNVTWAQRLAALQNWLSARLSVRVAADRSELVIGDEVSELHVPLPQPDEPTTETAFASWAKSGARL